MSRIEIRGIIVPSDFDGGWYQGIIDRGIITPESKLRRELATASKTEPLTVYLNTPGGSVFAGNEMVNAVNMWKNETKQKVHVIVGAMAASMGAAFTIQAADHVSVHRNSMMMFHGAWGVTIGGSEAMKDYSDVLSKINEMTKGILLKRYNLAADTIDEWFAEGREGWLTCDEMKAAGIAQEIIGSEDEAMKLDGVDLAEFDAKGLNIAALAQNLTSMAAGKPAETESGKTNQKETEDEKEKTGDGAGGATGAGSGESITAAEGQQGDALQPSNTEQAPGTPAGEVPPSEGAGISPEREAGRAEGRAAAVSEYADRVEDLKKQLAAAKANERKMQGERDKAVSDLARAQEDHKKSLNEMSAQLKLATDHVAKFLNGGLSFSPAPQTWEDALTACQGDYVKASRAYPELKLAYNEKHKTK